MKKTLLALFILSITLSGCINTKEPIITIHSEEASWAYEFVNVNGSSYQLTHQEAEESAKGELIGIVQRNIVEIDTEEEVEERHLDSNALAPGTPLYIHTENSSAILYEVEGTYFIAEKKD
ncbi:hypothetical protein AB685_17690 [Bacillus sp. LL01]|uniref:hypothetical protein n=1 Tax=Bacillus sp. LL01 TaxID=1665556 RepID=UPI00064CF6C2|nr:hypothetical protein [Bacillus sp. LL01]KMJ57234.1 hypothetical protein AB685_17690 [Bacillus sp. LL01]